MIDFRELAKKGVHFGHRTSRWFPKMAPYIWGSKNKTHLFNIAITASQLEKAAKFLEGLASEGKAILWVGTKKAAQEAIRNAALKLQMPHVTHRWVGGTLSNYAQVKKSVTKLLHSEDVLANVTKFSNYTKKELSTLQKMVDRLEKNVGGLRKLIWPIGAIVIIDVKRERSALLEAHQMHVPIIGLVDTNSDPSLVDFVIPGNDDAPQSIAILVEYLQEAVARGVAVARENNRIAQQAVIDAGSEGDLIADPNNILSGVGVEEENKDTVKKARKPSHAIPRSAPGAAKRTSGGGRRE
jgi:small subunit ribosomal protein S2